MAAIPDSAQRYVVVRATNRGSDPLHIRWGDTHLRWPNGFESPVRLKPADALETVYPGGKVEYHLEPVHYYLPPDASEFRRTSLDDTLVPKRLYEKYSDGYVLTLLIPTCRGDGDACQAQCKESRCEETWTIQTIEIGLILY